MFEDCLYRWHVNKLYHTFTYIRLPKDETWGSTHVEDSKNENISLTKVHFVGLYYTIKQSS